MGREPLPPARRLIGKITSHADPLVESTNTLALVVAWNAPFYPLYVLWVAGGGGMPWALLTGCSLPFFAAVLIVSRRFPLAARILFPVIGTINVAFCSVVLGEAAGEEIFLFACTVIAALAFRPHERLVMLCVAALPLGVHLALAGHYPIPPHIYTPAQYARLRSMNVISVTMLIILVGMVFSNARARLETTRV